MVVVSLCVEACASLSLPLLHKIRAKTMQSYPASQPVFVSDKLLEIERGTLRVCVFWFTFDLYSTYCIRLAVSPLEDCAGSTHR